jgi:hypothetical protein
MVEIEMPKGIDVVHFEATHLKTFQAIPRSQGPSGDTFRTGLAKHTLRFEVAAHRVAHFGGLVLGRKRLSHKDRLFKVESGRFFCPPIEPAALPMSLLERFTGKDAQSQLVLCLRFLARTRAL